MKPEHWAQTEEIFHAALDLPPAYYYLGDANFALALTKKSSAARITFLRKARLFFEQSRQAYAELPPDAAAFPAEIEQSSDIEKRIADCDAALNSKLNSKNEA